MAAERSRVDEVCQSIVAQDRARHAESTPPRAARCRAAPRGRALRRSSSPFAITYVRSASATVRCARCSTSSTVRPFSRIVARVRRRRRRPCVGDEPQRRLVEQQHVRAGDERAGDRELLLLAAGERARRARLPELADDREAARRRVRSPRASSGSPSCGRRWRFSSTVSVGEDRRPSGTSATPARAMSSVRRPVRERPSNVTLPPTTGAAP